MSVRVPKLPNPRIIVDTREQRPFLFGWKESPLGRDELHCGEIDTDSAVYSELGGPWQIERGTVAVGDYALAAVPGYPPPDPLLCFIERKEDDIVSSLSAERDRFMRECDKAAQFSFKTIVVCHPLAYLTEEEFRAKGHAGRVGLTSLIGSLISIATDRQIQVWTCPNRRSAEYFAAWTLRRAWRWHLNECAKAAKEAAAGAQRTGEVVG